ncbi:MAG: death domain-containing protein, partial [Proteobacteria bacterium]|nr:death domain-containing protein [Pseudomonadota bacterium]
VGEWYDLGLQLGLPDSTLASIASHPDVRGHKRCMLSEWLKRDTEASWDKLASALSVIGENVVSANIRSRFMKAAATTPGPVVDVSNEDDKTCKPLH